MHWQGVWGAILTTAQSILTTVQPILTTVQFPDKVIYCSFGYTANMKKVSEHLPAVRRQGTGRVAMSNGLTGAAQRLSLPALRAVALAVSKMNSKAPARKQNSYGEWVPVKATSTLHASDYAEAFGVTESDAYKVLQKVARELLRGLVLFFTPAHKRGNKAIGDTYRYVQWASACEYTKGEGNIKITWHEEITTHLLGLRERFTVYRLAQIRHLKHKSTFRLLALLEQFHITGVADYSLEDFSEAIEAPPSMRKDFGQLRRRIVDPAVRELNEHSDLLVTYETRKEGKKVVALRFTFKPNPQGTLDFGG